MLFLCRGFPYLLTWVGARDRFKPKFSIMSFRKSIRKDSVSKSNPDSSRKGTVMPTEKDETPRGQKGRKLKVESPYGEELKSLDEAKVVLRYFAGLKDILWFEQREGIKDIVITKPMTLVESMRTIISHKTPSNKSDPKATSFLRRI